MTIQISLDAGSNDSFLSGNYIQGTGLINEEPFWLQQNGSQSIWSYEVIYGSVWMIGDANHLGKFHGRIFVNADKDNTYPNTSLPVTFKDVGIIKLEFLR